MVTAESTACAGGSTTSAGGATTSAGTSSAGPGGSRAEAGIAAQMRSPKTPMVRIRDQREVKPGAEINVNPLWMWRNGSGPKPERRLAVGDWADPMAA